MRRSSLRFLASLFFFSAAASFCSAQDKPLKKINWGVTSLSGGNWIPWITKEAKIYEKHGLDVQLILLRGSGQTSAALLGGSIFASPVALPTVMLADLSGADLINVAHTVPGVQTKLLVKPEIREPKIFAVSGSPVQAWGLSEISSLNPSCVKMVWIRIEKLPGFPSARRRNVCRR